MRPLASLPEPLLVRRVVLPPEPTSAGAARRLLTETLREAQRERWADTAALAVTEVVTNAVLHAATELTVTVEVRSEQVDVRVHDQSPLVPLPRSYGPQATTGRGLALVAALTSACGVQHEEGGVGKEVWFRIRDGEQPPDLTADDLLDAWDVGDLGLRVEPEAHAVVLRALPPVLWLAARQHHDGLLRELTLYLAEHDDVTVDLTLADRARSLVSASVLAALEQDAGSDAPGGQHARGRAGLATHPARVGDGSPALDLVVQVPADLSSAYAALQDALDTAEDLARSGRLLVRPGLPEIVAVRDWVCEQVIAQTAGAPPNPWPGTAQERFETAGGAERELAVEWDDRDVRDSQRYVVAADDANRIIAVSRPLADLVGWSVEELVGRRVVTLIPPALREAHVAGFSRYLSTGEARVLGVPLDLPVLRADGTQITCRYLVQEASAQVGRSVFLAWVEPLDAAPPAAGAA